MRKACILSFGVIEVDFENSIFELYHPNNRTVLKRKLMEILACPIDKFYPLELQVFDEKEEINAGIITCPKCNRWYPIIDEIPHMLPDDLREESEDLSFLEKWKAMIPEKTVQEGMPFNLKSGKRQAAP
jgi:uncharacterized protein YbaR (Trm112 family)